MFTKGEAIVNIIGNRYAPFLLNIGTFLKILKYAPGVDEKMSSNVSDFEEDNDLNTLLFLINFMQKNWIT